MSNAGLIIEERSRDIGDFLVGRLLPFRKKRMVGPFIFIDHMGPSRISEGNYLDIGQHPHIGLSTLSYLFEGEIMHRDSIGSAQRITPGDVNLMTAGSGVTHTERTPLDHRDGVVRTVHGYQIWIALPKEKEKMAPEFFHIVSEQLPKWSDQGINYVLVAGSAYGKVSPVPTYSPQFMLDLKSQEGATFNATSLHGEIGLVIVEGYIEACGERIDKGNMLVSKKDDVCFIQLGPQSHVLLFGGKPLPEERLIYWNFVATDKETIEDAKKRWAKREFPMVPNEHDYIPLP
ncbi:MAG: pirin family protein [Bacteroidota bacterium]